MEKSSLDNADSSALSGYLCLSVVENARILLEFGSESVNLVRVISQTFGSEVSLVGILLVETERWIASR